MNYVTTDNALVKYMGFIRYCNSHINNETDFHIVRNILMNLNQLPTLSVDQIADSASVSNASVSRLIKKMGFSSAQDLKITVATVREKTALMRQFYYQERTSDSSLCNMAEKTALSNIQKTVETIDYEKMRLILTMLKISKKILFLGDAHELNVFSTLQIDFLNSGIPAFSYLDPLYSVLESRFLTPDDTVVFFNLAKEWMIPEYSEVLKNCRRKNARCIVFQQDDEPVCTDPTILYRYGIAGSGNGGYYSLSILNDIMCAMFWQI